MSDDIAQSLRFVMNLAMYDGQNQACDAMCNYVRGLYDSRSPGIICHRHILDLIAVHLYRTRRQDCWIKLFESGNFPGGRPPRMVKIDFFD